ncbi:MAG: condensation domain-containing protein, partial [Lachnospiraceae bacterium]|nr:condensation domain-containing protein [Lachnospiraceae bacterium]
RDRNKFLYAFTASDIVECIQKLNNVTVKSVDENRNGIVFLLADDVSIDCEKIYSSDECSSFGSEYSSIKQVIPKDDEKVNFTALQTAFAKTLIKCGINPDMILGCGTSNGAVAVLSGNGKYEELPDFMNKFGGSDFNGERFRSVVKEKFSSCKFISIFGENKLTRSINETVNSRDILFADESVADCLCRAEYMGIKSDYRGFFGNMDVQRISLPTYSFEKRYCWPKYYAQPNSTTEIVCDDTEPDNLSIGDTDTERKIALIWSRVLGSDDFDTEDDFFNLGGNSLMSMQLVNGIKEYTGVEIEFEDLYDYPTISELAGYIDELSVDNALSAPDTEITAENDGIYPVSYQQESMMIIFDRDRSSVAYNVPYSFRFSGNINKDLLVKALAEVVKRNNILHTVYIPDENGYSQRVLDNYSFTSEIRDITMIQDKDSVIGSVLNEMGSLPFDLENDIPIRAVFMKETENTYTLLMQIHHIAVDGWSSALIVRDLFECYNILKKDPSDLIPSVKYQYIDYARQSRLLLDSDEGERKKRFWTELLSECPQSSKFNFSDCSETEIGTENVPVRFKIDKSVYDSIKKYCLNRRISLFTYLISVYGILFSKYTSQDKVCFGTAFANRTSVSYENMIGYFVNTLPMLLKVNGSETVSSLIRNSNRTFINMLANQEIPFEIITSEMRKTTSYTKEIFSNVFVLQNTGSVNFGDANKQDFTVSVLDLGQMNAKFDTLMSLGEADGELYGTLEYDTSFLSRENAQRLASHYVRLINDIAGNEDKTVSETNMLDDEEKKMIYSSFEEDDDYDF